MPTKGGTTNGECSGETALKCSPKGKTSESERVNAGLQTGGFLDARFRLTTGALGVLGGDCTHVQPEGLDERERASQRGTTNGERFAWGGASVGSSAFMRPGRPCGCECGKTSCD